MQHRFLARLPQQPARLRRRLRHRRGSGIVLGSSALFCEFLRAINGEQRGNSDRRAGNGSRVQSLRQPRHAGGPPARGLRPCRARPSAMCPEQRQVPNNRRPQPQARGLPIGSCAVFTGHAIQRVAPTKAMLTDRRRILTFLAGSFATPAFFVPPAFDHI